ncbi:hypothetical protein CAPTEDRAFT_156744 [Capitella teleta]|uniref:Small monomeric GTPase n=1 Tax=Capitella teleta TaxID=283909 RepID=R7U591_CAPTE|nr:hypothetical protein CAPTEDRAFT_156744 [Capitella teleta]|eukprot:ELU01291.1 hypothetical protein CAPTEDRAFT_156744 [Capitella teleta]
MRHRSRSDATHDKEHGESGPVPVKDRYRIVVMGAAGVGKTCIINRFLYESFVAKYKATVEELHQGEYSVNGATITLDILDTTGSYAFPAMRKLSIAHGDAFLLVYSLEDAESFSEVKELRQQIVDSKLANDPSKGIPPIVIVGNKLDLKEDDVEKEAVSKESLQNLVSSEWMHGYIEASAKEDININAIFKELLRQAKVQLLSSPAIIRKRRQSFPASAMKNKKASADSCRVS